MRNMPSPTPYDSSFFGDCQETFGVMCEGYACTVDGIINMSDFETKSLIRQVGGSTTRAQNDIENR